MRQFRRVTACLLAMMTLLLGACGQTRTPPAATPAAPPAPPALPAPLPAPEPEPPPANPMTDVPGDKRLPPPQGALEQRDCKTGVEDLQARMAVEALGGRVTSFAYYSKWRPHTCSLDFEENDAASKWRLMPDGATRVQSRFGSFVIRSRADAYIFEFRNVQRQKFCGMLGTINGTMTIKRGLPKPECSVAGLLDRN
jgi:hypothetical protein